MIQLNKLKKNINKRIENFNLLKKFFKSYPDKFYLPDEKEYLKTAWLAYPIILKENSKFSRKDMQIYLEKNGIQTRTIFTGNILRQPIMRNKRFKKVKNAEDNANFIMTNGLLVGCHHGLNFKEIIHITKTIKKFIETNL